MQTASSEFSVSGTFPLGPRRSQEAWSPAALPEDPTLPPVPSPRPSPQCWGVFGPLFTASSAGCGRGGSVLLPGAVTVARPCVTSVPLPGGLSAKRGVGGGGGRGQGRHQHPRGQAVQHGREGLSRERQASGGTRVPRAVLPGPRPCPGGFWSEPHVGLDFRAPAGRCPLGLADCDPREAKRRPSATSKLNKPVSTWAVPPRRSAVSAPRGGAWGRPRGRSRGLLAQGATG